MRDSVMSRVLPAYLSAALLAVAAGCTTAPPKPEPPKPEPPKVEAPKPEPPKPPEFEKAYFTYNSAELTAEAREGLKRTVETLLGHPELKISVEGNCDERGTDQYNVELGWKRAYAVRDFLTRQGVDEARLFPISYGRSRPAIIGDNETAWSRNRRVEFSIRP